MSLTSWSINPAWQNFSSLIREAQSATDAKTGLEKSHHLTSALYFGIASLEAFLNQKMRTHLQNVKSEQEIVDALRKGRFISKLDNWPAEIIGVHTQFPKAQRELLGLCNDVRGDLTHPKTLGHDIYERLLQVTPSSLVEAVATYIAIFHEAQGTRYPYWIFGWNYLNPRADSYDIMLLNDQQFCFSLQALGFNVPAGDWSRAEAWKNRYFKSLDGYRAIKDALTSAPGCEPKFDRFPYQPKLCRAWWTPAHHLSCGHVSGEALEAALHMDKV